VSTIKSFEDLDIWKQSRALVKIIYSDFRNCTDFNFYKQITSAGLSIMNNSAEGFGRESDKEFDYFLNIAKGSALEVKSMYYIASDLGYLAEDISVKRRDQVQLIINSISKLKKYLKK